MRFARVLVCVGILTSSCEPHQGFEEDAQDALGPGAVCIMSVHGGPITCVLDQKLYVCAVHRGRAACAPIDDAQKKRLDAATGASE